MNANKIAASLSGIVQLEKSINSMKSIKRPIYEMPSGIRMRSSNYKCDYCDSRYNIFLTNCKNCGGTVKQNNG